MANIGFVAISHNEKMWQHCDFQRPWIHFTTFELPLWAATSTPWNNVAIARSGVRLCAAIFWQSSMSSLLQCIWCFQTQPVTQLAAWQKLTFLFLLYCRYGAFLLGGRFGYLNKWSAFLKSCALARNFIQENCVFLSLRKSCIIQRSVHATCWEAITEIFVHSGSGLQLVRLKKITFHRVMHHWLLMQMFLFNMLLYNWLTEMSDKAYFLLFCPL